MHLTDGKSAVPELASIVRPKAPDGPVAFDDACRGNNRYAVHRINDFASTRCDVDCAREPIDRRGP
jgi:hypothetical protein